MVDAAVLDQAAAAIEAGELVIYPTETVYGLGGDAMSPQAIKRVYAAKQRDRDRPLSMGLPSVEAISEYATPSERAWSFCQTFLPGPVTVVVSAQDHVPVELLGGRDRVGIRVPNHEVALALFERVAPVTATSANVSGRNSARRVADVDPEIHADATVVLDGGETPGGGSTVVDVDRGEVIRAGSNAPRIRDWLRRHKR